MGSQSVNPHCHRRRMAVLALLPLLGLAPSGWTGAAASERSEFDLRGVVRLINDGSAVPLARVYLESLEGQLFREAESGWDGRFSFRDLEAGQYRIKVVARGLPERRKTVDVTRSFADRSGAVEVTIELGVQAEQGLSSDDHLTVSVRRLTIPEEAEKEYERARRAGRRGQIEKKVRHLEKAIELAPDFAEAMNDLGTHHHRTGDYRKAIELFERAIEVAPTAFEPQVNLGGTLVASGRLLDAVQANRRALDLRPHDPLAQAQLGLAFFMLGRDQEALVHLQQAKNLDPGAATHPQLFLSRIYLRQGRTGEAIAEMEDFLHHHPDLPGAGEVRKQIDLLRREGEDSRPEASR